MDNAYTNKGTRSLYTLKSDKPMFKSRMKKEKENSNIISQTLDLKTYDELISKKKEQFQFKKQMILQITIKWSILKLVLKQEKM